jgi:hypothetical protein
MPNSPFLRESLSSSLGTRLGECGRNAVLEFESGQAAWGQPEAYLLTLAQETEFSVPLALPELQLAKGVDVPDLFSVITDEDVPDA